MAQPALDPSAVRRCPLLLAAFAFALGILFAARAWRPDVWWLAAAAFFAIASFYWLRRRAAFAAVAGLLVFTAAGALDLRLRPATAATSDLAPFTDGREVVVTAQVVRDGMLRDLAGDQRQTIDVQSEQVEAGGATYAVRAGIRLSIYSRAERDPEEPAVFQPPTAQHQFTYGERLRFNAKLRPPRNFGNPGGFDYRYYLAREGMAALASTKQQEVEVLPGFAGSRLPLWRSQARRALLTRIGQLWSGDDAGIVSAMLIGERSLLDRNDKLAFQRTGVFHVLVVSGLNVAIIAFCVFWGLRRLRMHDVLATAITMALCAAFAFLTDAGAPVVRATIMVVFYLVARLLYRERAPLNALGGAALLILLADPRALFDASFQLSFAAVLAIAGIALPVLERTSQPYRAGLAYLDSLPYDASVAPRVAQFRLDLRMIAARLARFTGQRPAQWLVTAFCHATLVVYDVVVVSALVQVALALPMAWYFHRAVLLGVPANVLVVPLMSALFPLALAAVLLSFLSTTLALPLAMLSGALLELVNLLLQTLASWRASELRVATPTPALAAAAAGAFALALLLVRGRRVLATAGVAALAATAAWIAFVPPAPQLRPGVLEITALDVGQGDALFVAAPDGRLLLIDAGGSMRPSVSEFDIGEDVVSPYLWSRGITRLDAIALTHAHADHIGGMRAIIVNFQPRELWVGANPPVPVYQALLAEAARNGVAVRQYAAGDEFRFGGAAVRVLAPPAGWEVKRTPRNNDSLALLLTYQKTSALLEGDAEKKIEKMIAEGSPRADLLKVGHHGSATSTTPELLAAVQPKLAIISVGYRSPFGHPRPEVLARLREARAITHRTDTQGAVTFLLDGTRVETTLPARR